MLLVSLKDNSIDGLDVIGCALAIVISFEANHSIWWAIVHGFFNWFYIVYYALTAEFVPW